MDFLFRIMHIQLVPNALSAAVKYPWRETDRSSPSNAEVQDMWRYTFSPHCLLIDMMLTEAQG
jgi:hypothetical protein